MTPYVALTHLLHVLRPSQYLEHVKIVSLYVLLVFGAEKGTSQSMIGLILRDIRDVAPPKLKALREHSYRSEDPP